MREEGWKRETRGNYRILLSVPNSTTRRCWTAFQCAANHRDDDEVTSSACFNNYPRKVTTCSGFEVVSTP
jgi:hypothetical protein